MELRIFIEPQLGATYDEQLAIARAAEESGFGAFFRSDHYMAGRRDPGPGPTDAWITLAGLARDTSRIRLGTLVSPVTFRHPGPLAISVAQVDAMSGGRVELGLGTGWNEVEHRAYALAFPAIGERFELLEEQLEVVTGLWATPVGERFAYAGKHYKVEDSPALPKPAQSPRPPVVVGGAGQRRTPHLAARFADEYNVPFSSFDATGAAFERVRAACDAAGRDPSTLILSAAQTTFCGADAKDVGRRAAVFGMKPEQAGLSGTPTEVVDRIGELGAMGAQRVYLQLLDLRDLDHVRLLADEVLPAVS